MQALLRSTTPLSQAELAEAAGVSTRSLRRYVDALDALTLVEATDDGLRFALPTREQRGGHPPGSSRRLGRCSPRPAVRRRPRAHRRSAQ
ncbi:helix-turn-helix domain-containing protein [Haloplanus litoreus]